MDRLEDMTTFVKVVETRSFTAAAQRLGLSKSVISRRVAELEDRLGARLLNRTTRKLAPTEAGLAYFERCVRILNDIEEAERAVGDLHAAPKGALKVSAPVSFATRHLTAAIPDFLHQYPLVTIDLRLNDRHVDLLEEEFDLAIRIGKLRDSSLVARRLASCQRALVASPAYLAARGTPTAPEELTAHDCLIYTNVPTSDQWRFGDGEGTRAIRVSGRYHANNGDLTLAAAEAGLGLAILPTFLCGEAIRAGRLVKLGLTPQNPDIGLHAVFPHSRNLSPKVRAFVDFLAARFSPVPPWGVD